MWQHTLNSNGTVFKEVDAYLTNFGVLVLPTIGNTTNGSNSPFFVRGSTTFYIYNNRILNIYGLVHTHPNGFHDSLSDPDDFDFIYMTGLPNFVIGKLGTVQMGVVDFTGSYSIQIGTTNNLFNGTLSLYNYLQQ